MLSPVLAHEPPPIGYLGPQIPPRTHLIRLLQYMSITPMHNVSGAPSISLPLAVSRSGLPIGALFSARRGEEALLLQLALQLEHSRPWPLLADA
jgi:amidase